MKTKTLSVLCLFALLSLNLATGSVIKRGLDDNKAVAKKNLVEVESGCESGIDVRTTGTVSFTSGGTPNPVPTGALPANQGAGEVVAESSGVLASIG
jgi:hypothetical protein